MRIPLLTLSLALLTFPLAAADFGFSVVIRAGDSNTVSGQWELGIGATGAAPSATASITPGFNANAAARVFVVGYTNATNTAYLRLYNAAGTAYQEVTYHPAGGGVPAANRRWDLPGDSFLLQAESGQNGQIALTSLTLSGVLTVLQPLSASTLTLSHSGTGGSTQLGSDVVFLNGGTGTGIAGDWALTGRIQISGPQRLNGSANRLRFGLDANATNTPEPTTYAMIGLGLLVFRILYRRPGSAR